MNKIDSALEILGMAGEQFAKNARLSGDDDAAYAFEAISHMLSSLAHRHTSPLLEAKRKMLITSGKGLDYQQALDRALAYSLWRMTNLDETRYRASREAARVSGINAKRLESFLPVKKDLNGPEGVALSKRLSSLIGEMDGVDYKHAWERIWDFEYETHRLADRERRWESNRNRIRSMLAEKGRSIDGLSVLDPQCLKASFDLLFRNQEAVANS